MVIILKIMNWHKLFWNNYLIFLVTVTLFVLPYIFVYYNVYQPQKIWNDNSKTTTCTIYNTAILSHSPTNCNCCLAAANGTCDTCKFCYGTIYLEFMIGNMAHRFQKEIARNVYSQVKKILSQEYPISRKITCYYNQFDPHDIKFEKYPTIAFFVLSCVYIVLAVLLFTTAVYLEIKNACNDNNDNNPENFANN